jgi:hypothetical protein
MIVIVMTRINEVERFKDVDQFGQDVEEDLDSTEYESIDTFAEFLFDDERSEFTPVELIALTRRIYSQTYGIDIEDYSPSKIDVEDIKSQLMSYGLKPAVRTEPKKGTVARTSMYAGNHGGSGFDNSGHIGIGSGRGTVTGSEQWSAGSSRNLSMGSKRR